MDATQRVSAVLGLGARQGGSFLLYAETRVQDEFFVCDDCREAYLAPAYYTFPPEACSESIGNVAPTPHLDCTGNLCPSCAIDLMPDDLADPRVTKAHLRSIGAL